jgi:hypothetical protein
MGDFLKLETTTLGWLNTLASTVFSGNAYYLGGHAL